MPQTDYTTSRIKSSASSTSSDCEQPVSKKRQQKKGPKRSVNTLSATQLERKRANDREAQRLIRQRTKDRIDELEKQVESLTHENERLQRRLSSGSHSEEHNASPTEHMPSGGSLWRSSTGLDSPSSTRDFSMRDMSNPSSAEAFSPVLGSGFNNGAGIIPQGVASVHDASSTYDWNPLVPTLRTFQSPPPTPSCDQASLSHQYHSRTGSNMNYCAQEQGPYISSESRMGGFRGPQ